jgi:hypothetical protein
VSAVPRSLLLALAALAAVALALLSRRGSNTLKD